MSDPTGGLGPASAFYVPNSNLPAVSNLLDGGAATSAGSQSPAWQPIGMPVTPAAFDAPEAVAAREEIKTKIGDKEFYKTLVAERERGVTGPASQAWAELHKRGWPSQPSIASQADVDNQAKSRNAEHWNSYIGALKQRFDITPEQEAEIRGGVIRADLHAWAREEKDRLIKDRGFRTKLLDGSRAENHQWGMITSMLSLRPVKQ